MINYFNDFNNPREFLFIKNDFLKKEIFDHYNSKIKALNWIQDERDSFWNNKISEFIDCSKIHEEIINLINKNFSLFKNNYFVKLSKNEFSSLSSHKKFFAENGQRIIAHYKIGIYFGNFVGDEVIQSSISNNQDVVISVNPSTGLVSYDSGTLGGTSYVGSLKVDIMRLV